MIRMVGFEFLSQYLKKKEKVKQTLYRPEQAQGVPGG